MGFVCCVPGCSYKSKEVEMHRFPRDRALFTKWIKNIKCVNWMKEPREVIYKNKRVCNIHFGPEANSVVKRRFSTLKDDAVPTLFLPKQFVEQISRGQFRRSDEAIEDIIDTESDVSLEVDVAETMLGSTSSIPAAEEVAAQESEEGGEVFTTDPITPESEECFLVNAEKKNTCGSTSLMPAETSMDEQDSTRESELWKFVNITCRLCSSECRTESKNIMQKKILEMIETCSSLQPTVADGLPTKICSSCLQSLHICFRFRKKIETTDVLLRKKLKLLPKQDILDIALNEADVKNFQNEVICSDLDFSNDKNSLSTIDTEAILNCYYSIVSTGTSKEERKSTVSKIDVEDILKCYFMLKPDEEKKTTSMFKRNSIEPDEKTENISYNIPLPPLVPIKLEENKVSEVSTQILPEELPPLIPLVTSSNENQSSNMILEPVETSKHTENLLENQEEICGEPSKLLFCNICKKEYKERKKLIRHLKGHMVPKNFVCKICGKKYPNPSTFQIHMRTHTGERPFNCPVCNKGFTRWAGVVSHMQTHEDNRPFKCDICSQSFKVSSNLERHKGLHAGVLPFCCNYCGKTFSQSANLQLHIRTYHTKERPYLCSECGKGFVSSTRLNRHMWVHTGYKPFHCKICSKGYSNSRDFKNHVSSAHGNGESEKPFCCKLCDKQFFYSCRLSKHFKTHHRSNYSNQTVDSGSNAKEEHMKSKQ